MSISEATLAENVVLAKVDRLKQYFTDYFRFNRDCRELTDAIINLRTDIVSNPRDLINVNGVSSILSIIHNTTINGHSVDQDEINGIVLGFNLRTLAQTPAVFDALMAYFGNADYIPCSFEHSRRILS